MSILDDWKHNAGILVTFFTNKSPRAPGTNKKQWSAVSGVTSCQPFCHTLIFLNVMNNDDTVTQLTQESEPRIERSITDALKAPTASDLARKRKLPCNIPHNGKRLQHPKLTSKPKNVSIQQHLQEFRGENFKESASTLFCTGCREEVGLKKTIIQQHIKSAKHCTENVKVVEKLARESDITEVLVRYDNEKHPKGETLSMAQRVYRFKVVRTFLKAGVPILKIDKFRDIFEEQGYSLIHSSNLSSVVDVINKEEKGKVKKEITGRNVSVLFDGTTYVAEALHIRWARHPSICFIYISRLRDWNERGLAVLGWNANGISN